MNPDSDSTAGAPVSEGARFGLKRRTILAGAAWTVPVIVAATATPAMAASPSDLSIAFNQPAYRGTACGTITGASVTATRNGQPAAGEPVTVSLSEGFVFADGSTTFTGVSGTNGTVALPDIIVPASGGASAISGVSGSAEASSTLSAPSNAIAFNSRQGGTPVASSAVPAGSTVVGWNTFLAPNGDLYFNNQVIATGVTSATATTYEVGGSNLISYVNASGAFNSNQGATPSRSTAVPAGSTPVGWNTFLAPNGDLYFNNQIVATGVTSAVTSTYGSTNLIAFSTASGSFNLRQGGTPVLSSAVPVGSKAVGWNTFLAPNGDLYFNNRLIATGVTSATATTYEVGGSNLISYVNASGAFNSNQGATPSRSTAVPAGSTPVGWNTFLAPNGDLYFNNQIVATRVTSAFTSTYEGINLISFTAETDC